MPHFKTTETNNMACCKGNRFHSKYVFNTQIWPNWLVITTVKLTRVS